jgi:RNA polymerase sigma-70 factor (ECF subfamily)
MMNATATWPREAIPRRPCEVRGQAPEAPGSRDEGTGRIAHPGGGTAPGAEATERQESSSGTLASLFDRNHRVLFRVAMRLLGDPAEAEDIVQESFLRAATHLGRVPETESGSQAWLVRVAVNLCRDRQRRGSTRSRRDRDVRAGVGNGPERGPASTSGAATEARLTVGSLLQRLPARRRAVLVLHELEGWSVAEIAETLGLRRVTVRWHLSAARRDLARWLDAGGGTTGGST